MNAEGLRLSVASGGRYLIGAQAQDGHWQEYRLPVGSTDAWISAYAGLVLAEVSGPGAACEGEARFRDAASRAADWLRNRRVYEAGWGFNSRTGPDADSTGWTLRLFRALAIEPQCCDVDYLLSRQTEEGGFATYPGPGWWGRAHPDVTPVAFLGLPPEAQAAVQGEVLAYLEAVRDRDDSWPSYWWRTCHYATFQNTELYHRLGIEGLNALPVVNAQATRQLYSTLDLACVLGVAALRNADPVLVEALCDELIASQAANGGWRGSDDLRVTDPGCTQPWIQPQGKRYTDIGGLFTTTTALRALEFVRLGLPGIIAGEPA